MRIRTLQSMGGLGMSPYSRTGKPMTMISSHYYGQDKPRRTKVSEQDSRVDKTHRD